MNKQKIKIAVIVVSICLAGICYSCGRNQNTDLLIESAPDDTGDEYYPDTASSVSQNELVEPVYLYVHICGQIVNPGVYQMDVGSRLFQVVEKAGGFTALAAMEYLNMAEVIYDGMKIVIPELTELEGTEVFGQSGHSNSEEVSSVLPQKVNLNTAEKEQLMTLRGIGEAKASDIIRYREEQGSFKKIEDIMNISGIKDAAFQKIKDNITV